jgi:tRNA-Thr(GGU) m(6)t(6)A37 methyltransferase TsaA
LEFHEAFRSPEAVRGIAGFPHIWLIFGFHQTVDQGWRPTVRPPRLGGNERVGVFASRSTFRPNGLGLSLVRLERVEGLALHLTGLDLVDGTPIYDVKPYLPYAEAIADAHAGFAATEIPRLTVEISIEAGADFDRLSTRSQAVVKESLALDPRPATQVAEPGKTYGASLCGCNIRFMIEGAICRILQIRPARASGLND